MIKYSAGFFFALLLLFSCQKEEAPDPFIDTNQNQDTVGFIIENPDPNSFAGIYQNVFKPTCSNVGCHDGTFEPDFRTMESAYNTLLFQDPIKNNGTYPYRVKPGDINESVLIARVENVLSPPMPVQIEPDSDWPEKKDDYISNMKTWILNGAKDISGNIPMIDVTQPQLAGAEMKFDTTWVNRKDGAIAIPDSVQQSILYFSIKTPGFTVDDLGKVDILFSPSPIDFSSPIRIEAQKNAPVGHVGYNHDAVLYTHSIAMEPQMDFDTLVPQWFFRIETNLNGNASVTLPNDDGIFYIKNYMSFVWN